MESTTTTESVAMREMPKYRCHKDVWALKIKEVEDPPLSENASDGARLLHFEDKEYASDGTKRLHFEDKEYASIPVSREYVQKHNPQPGGYYVVYEDGYKSFSPAEAFEGCYTLVH
jgi:hypothetical protein